MESSPESPELPPVAPREPILTLPGALIAYILLLAVIHLRVLLPPDLENWTIDVFGFIPKRYDSTLLAIGLGRQSLNSATSMPALRSERARTMPTQPPAAQA